MTMILMLGSDSCTTFLFLSRVNVPWSESSTHGTESTWEQKFHNCSGSAVCRLCAHCSARSTCLMLVLYLYNMLVVCLLLQWYNMQRSVLLLLSTILLCGMFMELCHTIFLHSSMSRLAVLYMEIGCDFDAVWLNYYSKSSEILAV